MTAAGYDYQIVKPSESAECGVCSGEAPPEFVARMAYQKAADVSTRVGPSLIIACDTMVECLGQVLGKPRDEKHAEHMLRSLSGREHRVYSGLCLWRVPDGEPIVEVDRTTLRMDVLSDEQIEQYLATGLWEGKAGAFGFQDGFDWLRLVEGSESNVVGLPMELLARMMAKVVPAPAG